MSAKNKSIMTAAVILTMVIGTLNSVYKNDKLPGFRFFFGSGVLWLFLIGIGEFEEEVSKNIAIAIAVFAVLGEGGGMLGHFLGHRGVAALDTQPPDKTNLGIHPEQGSPRPDLATTIRRETTVNTVDAPPYFFPVKPAIPNRVVFHHA